MAPIFARVTPRPNRIQPAGNVLLNAPQFLSYPNVEAAAWDQSIILRSTTVIVVVSNGEGRNCTRKCCVSRIKFVLYTADLASRE